MHLRTSAMIWVLGTAREAEVSFERLSEGHAEAGAKPARLTAGLVPCACRSVTLRMALGKSGALSGSSSGTILGRCGNAHGWGLSAPRGINSFAETPDVTKHHMGLDASDL